MSHMRNPELEFGDPRRLADDASLSIREKLEILENWRSDLVELQVAEEENMPSAGPDPGTTANKLEEVTKVIAALKNRAGTGGSRDADAGIRQPPEKPHEPGRDVPEPHPVDNPDLPGPKGTID